MNRRMFIALLALLFTVCSLPARDPLSVPELAWRSYKSVDRLPMEKPALQEQQRKDQP